MVEAGRATLEKVADEPWPGGKSIVFKRTKAAETSNPKGFGFNMF